ncbi:hypothetical protein WR25_03251 [Diploscapter pachys]|uniref:TraB domain-containing protein n=1 Tax=Diploscapter pachys TaxID=2018661 RepID=A0A2A2JQC6_9BILA|nr:hypothetical protein WR25_03251 [Diploscapter pachys]
MSTPHLSGSDPELVPAAGEDNQLTEEDLFRMKSLNSHNMRLSANKTADQSIVSLADSASNFDEHVGNDVDDIEDTGDFDSGPTMAMDSNKMLQLVDGWILNRIRQEEFDLNEATVTVLKWPTGLPIPECPPNEDEHQWKAAFQDATVYLIGTAHFSKESQDDVRRTIDATHPDLVMVELCSARISILSMNEETLLKEASSLNYEKVAATIKQSGAVQGILHVLLLSVSAHITRQLSMAPGGEFRAAYKAAQQHPMCRVVLGDRPIQITLQRALSSLSLWQKLKFFVHIIISQFSTITPEEAGILQN